MASLVVLFRTSPDREAFVRHYREVHLPLVRRLPGLRSVHAWPITGTPQGESDYQLLARLEFDDQEAIRHALRSSDGRIAGQDMKTFAQEGFKMLFLGDDLAVEEE